MVKVTPGVYTEEPGNFFLITKRILTERPDKVVFGNGSKIILGCTLRVTCLPGWVCWADYRHRHKAEYLPTNCLKMYNVHYYWKKQRGCRVESMGCKLQLIVDSIAIGRATSGQRNPLSSELPSTLSCESQTFVSYTWMTFWSLLRLSLSTWTISTEFFNVSLRPDLF